MSHQHMLIFAERLADAFLFGDNDRHEAAKARDLCVRSKRAGATSITTTEPEAPADTRWVDRRTMKRAR
jgi:hypothetical protein